MAERSQPLAGMRVLVIGGAGGGIGSAITRTMAAGGAAAVAIMDMSGERAEAEAALVRGTGARAAVAVGDVRRPADLDDAFAGTMRRFGGLDALVTVVGGIIHYSPWQPILGWSDDHWDVAHEVNLKYVVRAVRLAVAAFLDQGSAGSIVSIGSIVGVGASVNAAGYGAAKAGLMHLAKTVSVEYGRHGIRMNVVNPGFVDTPTTRLGRVSVDIDNLVPMRRAGQPEDIANAVAFLASPLSSYIAGQALNVDGGISAWHPLGVSLVSHAPGRDEGGSAGRATGCTL